MRRFLIATLFFASIPAFADVKLDVRFSPTANFIYQLDCVSEVLSRCSSEAYKLLWQKEVLKSESDQRLLEKWKNFAERYEKPFGLQDVTGFKNDQSLRLASKLRIASFQSRSVEDYLQRLDILTAPSDRPEIHAIIRHFYPRFEKWWSKVPKANGTKFAARTARLVESARIRNQVAKFAQFYEAKIPEGLPLILNLFYRPDLTEGSTNGEQLENYSMTEFLPKEKPEERLDVVIHELCHFFFAQAPSEKIEALRERFQKSERPGANAAYNLLNEGLASALGNGMINRVFRSQASWEKFKSHANSFYNDEFVDAAAKALLPVLDDLIKQKKSLYALEFVEAYLKNLESNLGETLLSPKIGLSRMFLIVDGQFSESLPKKVSLVIRPGSMWLSRGAWGDARLLEGYKKELGTNALVIVPVENKKKLLENELVGKEQATEIDRALAKGAESVLYGFKQPGSSRVTYFIVAKSEDAVETRIKQLAAIRGPLLGLAPALEAPTPARASP